MNNSEDHSESDCEQSSCQSETRSKNPILRNLLHGVKDFSHGAKHELIADNHLNTDEDDEEDEEEELEESLNLSQLLQSNGF